MATKKAASAMPRRASNAMPARVARAVKIPTPKLDTRPQWEKNLSGPQRDAYLAITNLFKSYGLGTLSTKIFEFVKNGYSADTISILLQETPEYKKRFAGNEARRKAGLNVLSPGEYISVENSYRQIMKQAGLPIGFYDTNEDFAGFIGNDLSPTELKERADLAVQATALAAPEYKQALRQMGISDSEMTAYWINQSKSLPFLQKTAATAAIGAEALQHKLTFDKAYAENLVTQGVTGQQAAEGYARIAQEFSGLQTLGQIYGNAWTQRQAEQGTFLGDAQATRQRARLISNEGAQFGGSTGAARGGLAQRGGQV
jgi:hypothetical protein